MLRPATPIVVGRDQDEGSSVGGWAPITGFPLVSRFDAGTNHALGPATARCRIRATSRRVLSRQTTRSDMSIRSTARAGITARLQSSQRLLTSQRRLIRVDDDPDRAVHAANGEAAERLRMFEHVVGHRRASIVATTAAERANPAGSFATRPPGLR